MNSFPEEFDDIRSYLDEEVNSVLQRLIASDQLDNILKTLFTHKADSSDQALDIEELSGIESVRDFQSWIEKRILPLIRSSYGELKVEGLSELDPSQAYIFISNHRDIVMDPLLLNQSLRNHGFDSSHCAIGDNLLTHPLASDLARLNRCFKVARSLSSPKAMLRAMQRQSRYIALINGTLGQHIWIAQKEGRSKDNSDRTNPALIKMLGLARKKSQPLGEYLQNFNIVPVCFSYEWDPCDVMKAQQLYEEASGQFVKTELDDLNAVRQGITGYKGDISIRFGSALEVPLTNDKTEKNVAALIDQFIHQSYRIFPVNIAASQLCHPGQIKTWDDFDQEDVRAAKAELKKRLSDLRDEVAERVLQAYARPVLSVTGALQ